MTTPQVAFDIKRNYFVVFCSAKLSFIPSGAPERVFRKKTPKLPSRWIMALSRRNVDYMFRYFPRNWQYSEEARTVLNNFKKGTVTISKPTKFPAKFPFKTVPYKHQMKALHRAFPLDMFAILFEQGLGKTKTAIDLATAWNNPINIIMCPNSIIGEWEDQIPEHAPYTWDMYELKDLQKSWQWDRMWRTIDKGYHVWLLLGIESLQQGRAGEDILNILHMANKGKNEVTVILDESSTIKNWDSNRTIKAIEIGQLCQKRLILTGTPVTQGYQDLYGQYQFLSELILGFTSYVAYERQYVVLGGGKYKRIVGYKNIPELLALIKPYTSRVLKRDALDLPPKIFQTRHVTITKEQRRLYNNCKDGNLEFEGREFENLEYILVQYVRQAQIVDGFLPYDETNPSLAKPIKGRNPKIEEVVQVMAENKGNKVVIWCRYRPEQTMLQQRLIKEGYDTLLYNGDMNRAEKDEAKRSFTASDDPLVFLLTIQAGCRGLNLQTAHIAITYGLTFSLEQILQLWDRIHRIGQEHPCIYVNIHADNTIDDDIQLAIEDKKDLADYVSDQLMKES